jgi:hypothetical protein
MSIPTASEVQSKLRRVRALALEKIAEAPDALDDYADEALAEEAAAAVDEVAERLAGLFE